MKQELASIIANDEIMPGIHLMWLKSPPIAASAQPGQFVMVRCEKEYPLRRPLSIHQRDGDRLALLFTKVGKGTDWLAKRKAGAHIDILGPMGNGFSLYPTSHNLLLIAGGIGIAPLFFLAKQALNRSCSVTLLEGASTANQLYSRDLLPAEVEPIIATEDGTTGKAGMITKLIPNYINMADQVFACGPIAMYKDMALKKRELKLEGKSVQLSLEVRMGCGLGACYGCTVKTKQGLKQVCKDGPVFELNDILWDDPFNNYS